MKQFYFIIALLGLISCQDKKEIIQQDEIVESKFNLETDYFDFKQKMTDLDTLKVYINHSVCTYQGHEKLLITKENDSICINSRFKEVTFSENPEWKTMYTRKVALNDTIWNFDQFLKRQNKSNYTKKSAKMSIRYKNQRIVFCYDCGLGKSNMFMGDYYKEMRKIFPENKNNIYGVDVP
ncbi:hypothetical protein [Aureivirga sp. CE67]|uniref:hypothetical protein n=1 Tax=Aureivirga sp. CE67 TaxID=1788983 RepID=UPI0018C9675B|nr:hypothetical protein [Aureivirga sp. CE67]